LPIKMKPSEWTGAGSSQSYNCAAKVTSQLTCCLVFWKNVYHCALLCTYNKTTRLSDRIWTCKYDQVSCDLQESRCLNDSPWIWVKLCDTGSIRRK
jgi:hypothetical protein